MLQIHVSFAAQAMRLLCAGLFLAAFAAAPASGAELTAKELVDRSKAFADKGEYAKAIADCTAVIGMKDVPADQVAQAIYNRGVVFGFDLNRVGWINQINEVWADQHVWQKETQ